VSALLLLAVLANPPDTLVVGLTADPVSLDPHRANDLVSAAVVSNVCEPLVRYRPDGSRPEAALATSWATADSRTWTFMLREGVRFHDGAPLDAAAVVANLEDLRKQRGFPGRASRAGPFVVTVTLDQPNAALLATLSQAFYAMRSPREIGSRSPARLAGSGPYRLDSARPGRIELAANPQYWGGAPRLRRIVFRRLPDQKSLEAALLAGEIDVTSAVGQDTVGRLRGRPGITLDSQTGLNIAFLCPNHERRPFADPRVRQALARAIDRHALVRDGLGGHGVPARNPLPPSMWGYAGRTKELGLDRAAALRLLAQAGYPDGFDTTLMTVDAARPYLPSPLRLAGLVRDELAQVGVRAKLEQARSWKEFLDRATRGDYALALLGWQADTIDPNDFLSALLASDSIGATNRSRYRSPQMDGLLKQGRQHADHRERASLYRSAQELFQKDLPWIPLYHVSLFTAFRRTVHGLSVDSTGLLRYDKAWKQE
jgi:peptide/nickel transport system substrate-binding protein